MVAQKLLIGIAGTFAAAVVTIGAVSAGGGGPIGSDDGEIGSEPEASPTPVTDGDEEDGEELENDDLDDADDAEDQDEQGEEAADGEDSAGNQKIAEAIAEEFDTTPEEVLALHDQGIGFGAIFKLYSLARARGITVDELLAEIEEDGGGFAFGKLKKSLTEEEMAILEEGPKNLGELVSGANKDEHEEVEAATADSETDDSGASGGGPPAHAKAKGHGKNK